MKRTLIISSIILFFLFIGAVTYSVGRDDDPYKYFTGLGKNIAISPDDTTYLFSYYVDGSEAIYQANIDGSNVKKITNPINVRHRNPSYSSDGRKLLFLSEDSNGIQSVFVSNLDGSSPKRFTSKKMHVSNAVFSRKGDQIYFVAIPSKDLHKAEGETKEGYDLYSIKLDGSRENQLTDKNHFSMNSLAISHDGDDLYYTLYGNKEKAYIYSIKNNTEQAAAISPKITDDTYNITMSPDESQMAYTAVSNKSKKSSLFEYELFLTKNNGKREQLTNLESSVVTPVFFHQKNKIAFLNDTKWPNEPEQFRLMTINPETKQIEKIKLDLPHSQKGLSVGRILDKSVSNATIAALYIILFGLQTIIFHRYKKKTYLPAIISLCLAAVIFLSSFVVGFVFNPWYGIGISSIALGVLLCTLVIFGFAYITKRYVL